MPFVFSLYLLLGAQKKRELIPRLSLMGPEKSQ
jgi:hypothetical protein